MSWLSDFGQKASTWGGQNIDIDPTHGAGFTGAGTPWGAPQGGGFSMLGMMDPNALAKFGPNNPVSPSTPTQTVPTANTADYSNSDALEQKIRTNLAGKQNSQNINYSLNLQQNPSMPNTGYGKGK